MVEIIMKFIKQFCTILILLGMATVGFSEEMTNQKSDKNQYCTRYTEKTILVNVSQQKLYLCNTGKVEKSYSISTAKNGTGSKANSGKTPLGRHRIAQKIGDGAEKLTIFKARRNTGQKAVLNAKNAGDLVTTRIMWLEGLEAGKNQGADVDSYQRYIYIHGTAEEYLIGQPASHGCVRMYNDDVVELFDQVDQGTFVHIVEN